MKKSTFPLINRESSWLAFNRRVLDQALNLELPLLERVKFLAISASNLDEFFMVRVGGLQLMHAQGVREKDDSGLTPLQQLNLIRNQVESFVELQQHVLCNVLGPELKAQGIVRLEAEDLSSSQKNRLREYFMENLFPVLSPIAFQPGESLPVNIPALQIGILIKVGKRDSVQDSRSSTKSKGKKGSSRVVNDSEASSSRYVVIWLPKQLPRHIPVPDTDGATFSYINLEDLTQLCLGQFFIGETIVSSAFFRLSRNTDIAVVEEEGVDLASKMEEVLDARKRGETIRLEYNRDIPRELLTALRSLANAKPQHLYEIPGELDLTSYFMVASLPQFDHLKVKPWPTQGVTSLMEGVDDVFELLKRQDVLLYHPYQSFDFVLKFIEQAARDPQVIAIKQVLYRTAKNSKIIDALIAAAESGKSVTVLVELKARFDEARNLERSEELIRAGAQIVFGVKNLKTHAKICLVVRRESGKIQRYIHFGTGNYNETTAKIYTDFSYLTCRPELGSDASFFFNVVTGLVQANHFQKISMAPFGIRDRLLGLIESEIDRAKQGDRAEIWAKMNSLQDPEMIEALYRASQAGVVIKLNIRGICCLVPGVKNLSENIEVLSTVDRYLEHPRVFYFHQGGEPEVFISSADWMVRNLSKRVELLVPILDPACREKLIQYLEWHFEESQQGWILRSDESWVHASEVKVRAKPFRVQAHLSKSIGKSMGRQHPALTSGMLQPHLPKK